MSFLTIENPLLSLTVNSRGAEMHEIKVKQDGTNLLWNGDDQFWGNRAPVLFPIVGGLKEDTFRIENRDFKMKRHGFVRGNNELELKIINDNTIQASLFSTKDLKEQYPFDFELIIEFILKNNQVEVIHQVVNKDSKDIFFSIGGHPAFKLSEDINKKWLVFDTPEDLETICLNQEGYRTDYTTKIKTQSGKVILNDESFDHDAWVFDDCPFTTVELHAENSPYGIRMYRNDFQQFGIWSKPKAPFVCLEPWLGLADHENHDNNFLNKSYLQQLAPNQSFEAKYHFEILGINKSF